ncbi:MAG: CDP-diacylglycerol--glycerol-3-phosphate 3-phosphatidyltransferase [Acidobacteriota bacterium]|nr:CDP-diacylglycerol--glycerol-3-phosphate 3-phosphatidyltransferase [Acidobacteriota bacterium]
MGRSSVLNLPNSITLSRIGCVPIFIWVLSTSLFPHGIQEALAATIFILASATDGLDGYLARKNGQISSVGMLLDPMADKLLVASGLILLVRYTPNLMPPWIVVLVLGREFLITGLRSVAAVEGFAISARDVGKFKMVVQIVAIVATVLAHGWYQWNIFGLILGVELVSRMSIWFMLAVTVISAVDYLHAFWGCLQRPIRQRAAASL